MAKKRKIQKIDINQKWCKRCGICFAFCPKGVYEKGTSGEISPANIKDCTGCRLCELYCPEYAISVVEED